MDITEMKMDPQQAKIAFQNYRAALLLKHNAEDEALMRGYKALMQGKTLIDLQQVFKECGVDEKGRPKLAIARASLKVIYLKRHESGRIVFNRDNNWYPRSKYWYTDLPAGTIAPSQSCGSYKSVVPIVPPQYRPKWRLSNYHILFEATWEDVPVDPILLRHLHGYLYAVLAAWDLTDIERAVISKRADA